MIAVIESAKGVTRLVAALELSEANQRLHSPNPVDAVVSLDPEVRRLAGRQGWPIIPAEIAAVPKSRLRSFYSRGLKKIRAALLRSRLSSRLVARNYSAVHLGYRLASSAVSGSVGKASADYRKVLAPMMRDEANSEAQIFVYGAICVAAVSEMDLDHSRVCLL